MTRMPVHTFTAPPVAAELTFSLTVTDTFGAFGSDTTTVTISNSAPVADAGVPQTVRPGTVTLDGTGSSDPDGDDLDYHWVQTDGTTVTLSDDTPPAPPLPPYRSRDADLQPVSDRHLGPG